MSRVVFSTSVLSLALFVGCARDVSELQPYAAYVGSPQPLNRECKIRKVGYLSPSYVVDSVDMRREDSETVATLRQGTPVTLERIVRNKRWLGVFYGFCNTLEVTVSIEDPRDPKHRLLAMACQDYFDCLRTAAE
jgi:hypothetical protein